MTIGDAVLSGTSTASADEVVDGVPAGLVDPRGPGARLEDDDPCALCALVFETMGMPRQECAAADFGASRPVGGLQHSARTVYGGPCSTPRSDCCSSPPGWAA